MFYGILHQAMKKTQVDKILDAANSVVNKHGIAKLTIDGVAAKVGMSKGGVLHHFRTKDKLVETMIKRDAMAWRDSFNDAYEKTSPGPGRMARGLMENCLSDIDIWTSAVCDNSSSVFAALAHDPKLIAPMREAYQELHERLADDELPPGVAETVLAAIDGIWLRWVLGLGEIDQNLLDRIRKALDTLVKQ